MSGRIRGFDGLRALAVITVVLTHLGLYAPLDQAEHLRHTVLPLVAGRTGVIVFFVLSGFLITLLLLKEYDKNGRISVRDFYVRRILRIFPLYFLVVGLTIAMQIAGSFVIRWESVPFALTYTYNFIPKQYYSSILGHTWSLAVEEHFYLIWPLVVTALIATRARLLCIAVLVFFVVTILVKGVANSIETVREAFFVGRWTIVAGGYIAIGAALALLLEQEASRDRWRGLIQSPFAFLLGAVLFGHSLVVGLDAYGLDTHARALGICLMIGWIYLNQQSALVSGLEMPPLRYLGRISYGIYMWQGFFLATGPGRLAEQTWPPDPWTGLILLALVAPLSYHAFETPILKLKARFSWTRPTRRVEGPAAAQATTF